MVLTYILSKLLHHLHKTFILVVFAFSDLLEVVVVTKKEQLLLSIKGANFQLCHDKSSYIPFDDDVHFVLDQHA
jgi:hypothetical protein